MSGKGSAPRPLAVDRVTYASNWERAFAKAMRRKLDADTAPADDAAPVIHTEEGA